MHQKHLKGAQRREGGARARVPEFAGGSMQHPNPGNPLFALSSRVSLHMKRCLVLPPPPLPQAAKTHFDSKRKTEKRRI
jgi:hypothetical protein